MSFLQSVNFNSFIYQIKYAIDATNTEQTRYANAAQKQKIWKNRLSKLQE